MLQFSFGRTVRKIVPGVRTLLVQRTIRTIHAQYAIPPNRRGSYPIGPVNQDAYRFYGIE